MLPCILALASAFSQATSEPIDLKLAQRYFQEAKWISDDDNGKLWGQLMYGPIILVDPRTRSLVSNEKPEGPEFENREGLFVGKLPATIGIANYALNWQGKQWTMLMWPLPSNRAERSTLIMHELFHRLQPSLGIPMSSPQNGHLETLEGRLWLQLEMGALADALSAATDSDRDKRTTDALLFRSMRHRKFSTAKKEEDQLELNEGLAQFTGYMLRGGWEPESRTWMATQVRQSIGLDTYARRFAYFTGTAYALLLNVGEDVRFKEIRWRKALKDDSSLSEMTAALLGAQLDRPDAQIIALAKPYGYDALKASETKREKARQERIVEIRKRLFDGPVLTLPLEKLNISFNPSNVFPMGEEGTYYPTATLINEWGTLEVTDGIFISADRKSARIAAPASLNATQGPGWKINLKSGWHIVEGKRKGDFAIGQR